MMMSFRREPSRPATVAASERMARADEFAKSISDERTQQSDTGWVFDFAVKAYEDSVARSRILDQKAELIGFTGTGAAILAGLAVKAPLWVALASVAPVSCGLATVIAAFRVLRPRDAAAPPQVDVAWRFVEQFGETSKALFIGQIHLAREFQTEANEKKAKCLDLAFRLAAWTVGLLLAPLLTAIITAALED